MSIEPGEEGEQVHAADASIANDAAVVHGNHHRPVGEGRPPVWPPQSQVVPVDLKRRAAN